MIFGFNRLLKTCPGPLPDGFRASGWSLLCKRSRGSVSCGKHVGTFLSRAREQAVSGFSAPAQLCCLLAILASASIANSQITPAQPAKAPPAQVAPGQVGTGQPEQEVQSAVAEAPPPLNVVELNQMPVPTPIDFQSRGLDYEALTREGITVMFATLPPHIKDFNIVQITVTNGSPVSWTVRPEDLLFVRPDGVVLQSLSADFVVESLLEKASRNDVIKLELLYEDSIYALSNFRSTNGYEKRREAAMAQFVNRGFKAAAAASAITLVSTKLRAGESTDGAVFFMNRTKEKGLGPGRLVIRTCGQMFLFQTYGELKAH